MIHKHWLLHNSHLHKSAGTNHPPFKHLHQVSQVTAMYECKEAMLPADREEVLDVSLETLCKFPTNHLHAFFDWANPLVKYSVRQASLLGTSFQTIDMYFLKQIPAHLFDVILPGITLPAPTSVVP